MKNNTVIKKNIENNKQIGSIGGRITKKKHILIFSTAYHPFVAGAEVSIKEITDRLSGSFEFDLITARMDKNLPVIDKIGTINIYRIGLGKPLLDKMLLPWWGAAVALRLSLQKKYSCFWAIMVTYGSGAAYICNIFRKILRKNKIPVVLSLQEGDSEEHLTWKWAGLIAISWRLALINADVLTALSNFLLNRAERFGYKGKKYLLPNGVDLRVFRKIISEKDKKSLRANFGKKPGDIFLITVSRLVRKNAVDDIISALPLLPENISLVVVGRGVESKKLYNQAKQLGVISRVKFLGYVPHSDIPALFSVCDIFIRPSRSEGFGNSFIEAMAAKLPVIATPVGGIPDFIDDKETGFFCAPDNPKSVAKTVMFILDNQKLAADVVYNAYMRVISRYDWQRIAETLKNKIFSDIFT